MLQQAFSRYINNFRGFRREVWILAIITFINRAGTMVLPFLTRYMNEDLHFTYSQVGNVLIFLGLGSMLGSWLGGKLSDKIGFYKIMVFSLFTSGLVFFVMQFVRSYYGVCISMFVIMMIADMFRPAMFVSLSTYAKPENRTRAFTLVRLAVNLGFAAGPAMAGLIIMGMSYQAIFWIDGASCIIAILLFTLLVKEKKKPETERQTETIKPQSAFKDIPFVIFLFSSFMTALLFFQLFTTLPLYHQEWYGLKEIHSGLLLSFNGLMIFAFEMPIVGFFERKNVQKIYLVLWGTIFMAISFFLLLYNVWAGILVISMFFMTFGEMFCFPFSNSFAMGRAPRGQEGKYMGLYTMTFSLAHILSGKTGLAIISDEKNYQTNWLAMALGGLVAAAALLYLQRLLRKETA
jgi:predicted MFS family arabinose efflux permease